MPRKATGQYIPGPEGIAFRYWKTVRHDEDGKPIKERVTVPLGTHNQVLAEQLGERLLKAEAEGRAATVVETFEAAAARVQAIRLKTIPGASDEMMWVRNHVTPAIGPMLARDVEKPDIMAVLEHMRDQGYTDQSIRHVRNAVHAIYKRLKSEGVVKASPAPDIEELPEALPESVDERPKAVLSDEELFTYLEYSDPRDGELYRGAVRERQLMTLLSRCVGGMRTMEIQGLTWSRARAEDGSFAALEVIRYKNRRKAAKRGSKTVARQLYPLGDTVLPFFLRYWYVRRAHVTGTAPSLESVLFPRIVGEDGAADQKREKNSLASKLRRDVKRAFGLEVWNEEAGEAEAEARRRSVFEQAEQGKSQRAIGAELGMSQAVVQRILAGTASGRGRGYVGRWEEAKPREKYTRRELELFEGTEDRRPLWFHNARNMAAIAAERVARLQAAAQTTAHTGKMLQHYREMAGEVDVVPVLPDFLPDGDRLVLLLRDWCRLDGIDIRDVFGGNFEWPTGKGGAKRRSGGDTPKTSETRTESFHSVPGNFSGTQRNTSLLSRRPEVRVLSGAPETTTLSRDASTANTREKAERKGGERRNGPQQTESVSSLPPGVVTASDLRKAIDAALVDGDVHLARRLNALAGDLEQRATTPRKGGRRGER
jgi:site-specific recombinase XerD